MKKLINSIFFLVLLTPLLFAQESEVVLVLSDVDKLLILVEENTLLRSAQDQERLNEFLKSKNKQEKLLNDAKWLLKKENDRERLLTKTFEDNDAKLSDLEEQLNLYRVACGKIPWLIGGRSEKTWTGLPDELQKHISSNKISKRE